MWQPSHRIILGTLVGTLVIVATVEGWSLVHQSSTTFRAGTHPNIQASPAPKPILPMGRDDDPMRGSTDPKAITIVEFADFDCPYCRLTDQSLSLILSSEPDVRVRWRDLPIPNNRPDGMLGAIAGRCATAQGRFWEMHDALYAAADVRVETVKHIASTLGFKQQEFDLCLSSSSVFGTIQHDVAAARASFITAAPTLFIGTNVIEGMATVSEIRSAVRQARLLKR